VLFAVIVFPVCDTWDEVGVEIVETLVEVEGLAPIVREALVEVY
jgi:hypothetical protein